jgi:hypothetical protein
MGTATIAGSSFAVTQAGATSTQETVLFVPIVLDVHGNAGSHYTSELTLTNRGANSADVRLTYTGADSLGGGSGTVHVPLAAGRQLVVSDAISYLKGLGISIPDSGSRGGTLAVGFTGLVSASEGLVSVRTTTPVTSGQAGLAYAGVRAANLLTGRSWVAGLREDATDRSNLALQNAGTSADGAITLRVTAHPADGSAAKSLGNRTLQPGGFVQLDGILAGTGMTSGYIEIERVSGSAPYDAYGVINDNTSSDGCFVSAQPEGTTAISALTIPVVVEASVYTSELVLTNFSSSSRSVTLSLVADTVTTSDHTARVTVTLGAKSQLIIPNITQYYRDQQAAGIPSQGSIVGALFVTPSSGDAGGLFAAARTWAGGEGGRFGVFYPAVSSGGASTSKAWLVGLRQTTTSRTNLAIVNTGASGSGEDSFEIDLYDGTTGSLAATVTGITRAAKAWGQVDMVLSRFAPGVTQGYACVRRTSGTNPFIAYAVVNDGGSPGQRSNDGAFVASSPD